jgi:catechol 2,3-dioxygenase-like lactoylglutathione lyase family enzyme
MDLFMVEVRVADLRRSARWYAATLGLTPLLDDPAGGFALLAAGPCRVALKEGHAEGRRAIRLVFEVADVDAEAARLGGMGLVVEGPTENSRERYRSLCLHDPDGTPIDLFSWISRTSSS